MLTKLTVALPPPPSSRLSSPRRCRVCRCSAGEPEKGGAPPLLRLAVGGVTELLRLLSPKMQKSEKAAVGRAPNVCCVDDVLQILRSDFDRAYFLTGDFTADIYAKDCLFEDPTITFRGKDRYSQNLELLVPFLDLPYLELEKIEKGQKYEINYVQATWKLRTYLNFPWRPLISIKGTTTYDLDEEFKIIRHAESWNISALEALGQIFKVGSKVGEK